MKNKDYIIYGNKGNVWKNTAHAFRNGKNLCGTPALAYNHAKDAGITEVGCPDCIRELEQEMIQDNLILAVSSGFGRYAMQVLLERYKIDNEDELQEEIELLSDPEKGEMDEWYHDAWIRVLDNAKITIEGKTYGLLQTDDIWLVPEDMVLPEWFLH